MSHSSVLVWEGGDATAWNARRNPSDIAILVVEITAIPDLSAPRFKNLGDAIADRRNSAAREQVQMLAQLHSLGNSYRIGIALRYRKHADKLRCFIVIRVAHRSNERANLDELGNRIIQMIPRSYSARRVTDQDPAWLLATDLSWATEVTEHLKNETMIEAHSTELYVVPIWLAKSDHDMNNVARVLLSFQGDALIECTLVPTDLHPQERDWIAKQAAQLREYERGMTITINSGRSHRLAPAPQLSAPAKNYEDILTRYGRDRLFMYSIRIFADGDPFSIAQALLTGAFTNQAYSVTLRNGDPLFKEQIQSAYCVDIAPEVRWERWSKPVTQPYRAQRLHRLVDSNELAGVWRLPIADRGDFPGFVVDSTGLGGSAKERNAVHSIHLGSFSDDPTKQAASASFDREALARHGLIVGVPGSGKTTLTMSILRQLWLNSSPDMRVPFIVLEPAKTEYRALMNVPDLARDILVFTLGDERISPFRFNPFAVPDGISLESHIARLNAAFTGAFNLFDPLPLLLDRAIRETYAQKGWLDESVGGEPGVETPQLSDLIRQSEHVLDASGYSDRLRDDIRAALLQRLDSLRRGSKGRMLDTPHSIPFEVLMHRPVILELDALNGDEKALMMMFVLNYVYEYARSTRRSGAPLRHVLVVEEAHNLIGRNGQAGSDVRANPREQAIQLFIRMLAEMRALGEGILIADQLPTALAPEAVKQTNLKVLMRLTALDDREEIGNTMDLDAEHLKAVTHFRTGQAYVYLDGWDRVRPVETEDFKTRYTVNEPQDDATLAVSMSHFEQNNPRLFMPLPECNLGCVTCTRRVRSLVERSIAPGKLGTPPSEITACEWVAAQITTHRRRAETLYGSVPPIFDFCARVHALHVVPDMFENCRRRDKRCTCQEEGSQEFLKAVASPNL